MLWLILTLLATTMFAIVQIIDKIYMSKWIKQPAIPVIIFGFIGIAASFVISLVKGLASISIFNLFIAIISGASFVIMSILYFKAIQLEEVSRVGPLFHLAPIFVLIIAAIFLNESFTLLKYIGIFLLVAGAILLSIRSFDIKFNKSFFLMIFAALFLALSSTSIKYLLNFMDYWSAFSYARFGAIIILLPVIFIYLPDLKKLATKQKEILTIISSNELINITALFIMTVAISIGFVTLVQALITTQIIFVLLFSTVLSIYYPKILEEEISKNIIFQKIIAIILMLAGAIIVA